MSTTTEPTRGPWYVSERDGEWIIVREGAVKPSEYLATGVSRLANARLMAASPDLYDCCLDWVQRNENGIPVGWHELHQRMSAAIARVAEGRE